MDKIKTLYSNKVVIAFFLSAILIMLGQIIAPGFADFSNVMNILSLSSFLGIAALAQTIVIISGSEGIDLSVGSIMSLSCVISSQIINGNNFNVLYALAAILAVGFAIGAVNGIGIAYFKIPSLIMTLAMASVVQGLAIIYTNGQPKGKASQILVTLGTERILGIPNIFILWLVITAAAMTFLKYTSWGNILYGVGSNVLTAELSGIKTRFVRMTAFGLSGLISAFAGLLLLGYTGTAYMDVGAAYVMPSIAAVVIGGISLGGGYGSYLGVTAGAVVLTTLGSILVALRMGESGRQIIYGVVLILLLLAYARQKKTNS